MIFTTLTSFEFNEFAKIHPDNSIFQSTSWCRVKSNWTPLYIGVKDQGALIAGCVFLLRELPLGFKLAYSPRGPLLDFEKPELVQFFFTHCRKELRKHRVILGKFDPNIIINDLPLSEKDQVPSKQLSSLTKLLSKNRCRHLGYTLSLKQTIQPRIQLSFPITPDIDEQIPTKTKKKIRSCLKKGVVIKEEITPESLATMVEYTQNRHHIKLRNSNYFKSILENFQENSCVLSAYLDDLLISSCLVVRCNKTTEILYSGYHDDYRKTDSTYLLRYHAIQWGQKHGCSQFNFGGVEGTLDDGLFMFKSSFNPHIQVYIGEFDLYTYPFLSVLASHFFPVLKSKISIG